MSTLEEQKASNKGVGWGKVIVGRFKEDVEQHDVERAEDANHQRLKHQKRDHVLLHARLDRLPGGDDAQRHQERGQDDEQHRNAIDAQPKIMQAMIQAEGGPTKYMNTNNAQLF